MKVSKRIFTTRITRLLAAASVFAVTAAAPAHALTLEEAAEQDPAFFQIQSDVSRELAPDEQVDESELFMPLGALNQPSSQQTMGEIARQIFGNPRSGTQLDQVEVIVDQLIRIGSKIYKIVEAGKPIYNSSTCRTDIIPQGITNWMQLSGWKAPISRRYERTIKNMYNSTVVYLRYRIEYTPGGNYKGRGKFLQAVTIVPESVYVAWGYSLDVSVTVPSITNAGSRKNPIAAAQLMIDSKVSTVLNTSQNTESYYVRGDGMFMDMQRRM